MDQHDASSVVKRTAKAALEGKLSYARSLDWFVERCPAIKEVHDASSLARIPLLELEGDAELTLADLAEFSHRASGGGLTLTSGGSTGGRKQLTHSWPFNERVMELGARGFLSAEERPAVILNCLTAGEMQGAFLFACGVAERIGARVLPAGWAMHREQLIALMESHHVDTLVATPSFASSFLCDEGTSGARLSALRRVLFIGEAFSEARSAGILTRFPRLIIRSLGYSSTETGPIGFQCQQQTGSRHHVHADAMHIEVIDPVSLRPVVPGEEGELIVTPLIPDHAPMFRYRIGDLGRFETQCVPCPCGSPLPVITLLGRAERSIKLGGALITQRQVLSVLRRVVPELAPEDIQVQYSTDDPRGAHITLALSSHTVPVHAEELIGNALAVDEYASMLLKLPGVARLSIRRCSVVDFICSRAGKSPFFVQTA